MEEKLGLKCAHSLSIDDQVMSSDYSFYVKDLNLLQRNAKDIIIVDKVMGNYSNRLTNGVYLPEYDED